MDNEENTPDTSYEVDNRKRSLAQRCSELVGVSCGDVYESDFEDLLVDLIKFLEE
jgi:hypothetical protein